MSGRFCSSSKSPHTLKTPARLIDFQDSPPPPTPLQRNLQKATASYLTKPKIEHSIYFRSGMVGFLIDFDQRKSWDPFSCDKEGPQGLKKKRVHPRKKACTYTSHHTLQWFYTQCQEYISGNQTKKKLPFPDVIFPPFPLSALSSSPFHCPLQDGFGQT